MFMLLRTSWTMRTGLSTWWCLLKTDCDVTRLPCHRVTIILLHTTQKWETLRSRYKKQVWGERFLTGQSSVVWYDSFHPTYLEIIWVLSDVAQTWVVNCVPDMQTTSIIVSVVYWIAWEKSFCRELWMNNVLRIFELKSGWRIWRRFSRKSSVTWRIISILSCE